MSYAMIPSQMMSEMNGTQHGMAPMGVPMTMPYQSDASFNPQLVSNEEFAAAFGAVSQPMVGMQMPKWEDNLERPDSPFALRQGGVQIGGEDLDVTMAFLTDGTSPDRRLTETLNLGSASDVGLPRLDSMDGSQLLLSAPSDGLMKMDESA